MSEAKRPSGPKRVGDLVRPSIEPALARQGFAQTTLILDWRSVVGERTAALCEPARLQWPRRGPKTDPAKLEPATLWLRVAPGRALDVQYQGAAIIERVNAHVGWRCVAKIAIRPEPMRPKASRTPPAPDADALARGAAMAAGVADAGLRAALARLGAAVIADGDRRRRR